MLFLLLGSYLTKLSLVQPRGSAEQAVPSGVFRPGVSKKRAHADTVRPSRRTGRCAFALCLQTRRGAGQSRGRLSRWASRAQPGLVPLSAALSPALALTVALRQGKSCRRALILKWRPLSNALLYRTWHRSQNCMVMPWLVMYKLHLKCGLFAAKLFFRLEHPPLQRLLGAGSRIGSSTAETVSTICAKEQSSCRV